MGKHRKVACSSATDPVRRANFLVNLARLVLELIRWLNGAGPGL